MTWERDQASPNASALVAISEAGCDVPFILFGRTKDERRADDLRDIQEEIAAIKRGIIDCDGLTNEAAKLSVYANQARTIAGTDAPLLTDQNRVDLANIRALLDDPERLRAFRVAEHKSERSKRDQMRHRLLNRFEASEYRPSDTAIYMMLTLLTDYDVPVKLLADLVEEVQARVADDA